MHGIIWVRNPQIRLHAMGLHQLLMYTTTFLENFSTEVTLHTGAHMQYFAQQPSYTPSVAVKAA
jgi:hypothetical protein